MARKRTSSEGGISLDSLMDALTNVVAVLILVLVLVQADVSRKVQQFLDDIQPATPEDIAQTKRLIDELERKQRVAEARLREKPATAEDIEEEKRQIALLEKSAEENKELLADLDEVRKLEKKVRAERETENTKTVTIQKEIARLEALLDTIPSPVADTPTVVNIPNSRPIPGDAKTYEAIVIRNRVHFIDPHTPLEIFQREFERKKGDWLFKRNKVRGKTDQLIYDPMKIAAHFKDFDFRNARGQKVQIVTVPTGRFMMLVIRPDLAKGGTALEDLAKPDGQFAKAMPVLRQTFRNVLLYRVNPDSFGTYLAARELSEKANIPSGWEISRAGDYKMRIPDLVVRRLQDPPPRPANPPPPGPPKPPPLKPKLD